MIENTFGILAARWQIFHTMLKCHPDMATNIVKACVVLHNMLQKENISLPKGRRMYCTPADTDSYNDDGSVNQGLGRASVPTNINLHSIPSSNMGSNNYRNDAKHIRDTLCEYFSSPVGTLDWHNDVLHHTL